MPLCRILDRLVLFVHIPKAGGTSIERFLAASGQIALLHGRKIRGMNMTPQHIHAAHVGQIQIEQDKVIVVDLAQIDAFLTQVGRIDVEAF